MSRLLSRRDMLTPELIRSFIRHDGKDLYWLPRDRKWFTADRHWQAWNRRMAGRKAKIKTTGHGHQGVVVFGWLVGVHRIIWVLRHGVWPTFELDHINGDPTDNRIENLRDVPRSINRRNSRRGGNNTSGMSGVCPHSDGRKGWRVYVGVLGKQHFIGNFKSLDDAVAARREAQARFGFTARHGGTQ